jgi:hypothetical protein
MLTVCVSVADLDHDWIRMQLGLWTRIQEGKNDPQKKSLQISCFEVLDILFGGLVDSLLA